MIDRLPYIGPLEIEYELRLKNYWIQLLVDHNIEVYVKCISYLFVFHGFLTISTGNNWCILCAFNFNKH